MALVNVRVVVATSGANLAQLVNHRALMLRKHREFSRRVVDAFASTVDTAAPRDTGFMAARMSTVRQIRGAGSVDGYGAGAYSLIGNPKDRATPRTIASFIKANPKMRGSRPVVSSGAWWTLTPEGKDKLRNSRRHGAYGGSKPAYWYAIASGLVPNAVGGTLTPNIFVDLAIDFANAERAVLARGYFGL